MAVVEISGSSVTTVQVVDALQQLVVFHTPPPTGPEIRHDTAIGRGGRIDGNGVHSSFSRRVIKTTRAARHPYWLRAERGKTGRAQRVWIGEIKFQMLSRWDAGCHPCMLIRGSSHPCGIKPACRKRQTVVPVLFQSCQTSSFTLWLAARNRHVALGFRSRAHCEVSAREYGKCHAGESEEQCEQHTEVNEPTFAQPPSSPGRGSAESEEVMAGIFGASGAISFSLLEFGFM